MNIKNKFNFFICVIVIFFNVVMLIFPKEIVSYSSYGFNLWVKAVIPALLPFIIGVNILNQLGFVKFLGVILNPIMEPIFGVSGAGAFPLVAGMSSGYPLGAKLTSELYMDGSLNKKDATKLLCYTNNCGPLFIIGAVGVGMFKSSTVGYFILFVHYFSAIMLGIIINLIFKEKNKKINNNKNMLSKAFESMYLHIKKENKTIGQILGDSVYSGMITLIIIGGFIILFSVVCGVFDIIKFSDLLYNFFGKVFPSLKINKNIFTGIFSGIIEMTNGCNKVSTSISKASVLATCFLVSFGGFSIHAQSITFISKTDLSIKIYLIGKFLCGIISLVIGLIFYNFVGIKMHVTVFNNYLISPLKTFTYSSEVFFIYICIIFFLAGTVLVLKGRKN